MISYVFVRQIRSSSQIVWNDVIHATSQAKVSLKSLENWIETASSKFHTKLQLHLMGRICECECVGAFVSILFPSIQIASKIIIG